MSPDAAPGTAITSDNVTVKVNAVVYFRVVDPLRAIIEVENYLYAASQLSQTTLRSVLGEVALDDLLSHRTTPPSLSCCDPKSQNERASLNTAGPRVKIGDRWVRGH